jgi:hypothetical protein
MGCNSYFFVINVTPIDSQSSECKALEELTTEHRNNFWSLLYYDFPEFLQHVNSPPLSRQWDHPIKTTSIMRR